MRRDRTCATQTELLTSGADYAQLHEALYQACLYNLGANGLTRADCDEVREATLAVEMDQPPPGQAAPAAPICEVGLSPFLLFQDTFEAGSRVWQFEALSGANRWQLDSPYGAFAYGGSRFLYADDFPAQPADSAAAMGASVSLPPGQPAYLRFAHAYGFEDDPDAGAYDGGVLEYSANSGAWTDAAALFDANGYDDTLPAGYGNPLAGRAAFVRDSGGYLTSRLDLTPLAGQAVRFRWRLGLDSSRYDRGWWVDEVWVYTCGRPRLFVPLVVGR